MREITRRISAERPSLALRRSADGRLKSAGRDADIADIWAEQKRIQLREAIEEQKRKELKKQRRKERGLFGLKGGARKSAPTGALPAGQSAKEIEIRISMPTVRLPDFSVLYRKALQVATPLVSTRRRIVGLAIVVLLVGGITCLDMFGGNGRQEKSVTQNPTKTAVLSTNQSQTPSFATVLPAGKKIEDLGGWGRVSPPNNAPVFAYSDTLADVHIVVSEQQLPDGFAADPSGELAKISKQFNASKKLTTTDGLELYLGVASNGAQSVIASKNGLLILIRSASVIGDQVWSDYVYSLE